MANLRLKKLILEVVDNQLRDNDPPVTREAYDRLIAAGYSVHEAKEKIGAVVIEEIYDVMKENQPYDEKRYASIWICRQFLTCRHVESVCKSILAVKRTSFYGKIHVYAG